MTGSRILVVTFAIVLACTAPAKLKAQAAAGEDGSRQTQAELIRRLQELEKEVGALRSQVAELTKPAPEDGPNAHRPEHLMAKAGDKPAGTPADKPAANPLAGLTAALGGATFTGFVDAYYGVNFNQPASHTAGLRSWDNLNNGFALNMVNFTLDKPPEASNSRMGYHASLAFGSQMNLINNAEPTTQGGTPGLGHNRSGWDQYLLEGYFSYLAPVGKGLQFDFGKFVTPTGAEVVPTKDNWNYTRSLLYDYAIPIYHFGLRAKYAFNNKIALTGFVLNGWNNVLDNNSGKTGALQLSWNPTEKLCITHNYMVGPEQNDSSVPGGSRTANDHWRQLTDTTVAYSATRKLTLQTNFDYGRDTVDGVKNPYYWTGIASYVRYAHDAKNAFTIRHEYYLDHDGFTTGTPQHMHEVTATLERRFAGHMISRLEFRRDMSNRPIFFEHSLPTATLKNQNTVTAGVIYVFEPSEK